MLQNVRHAGGIRGGSAEGDAEHLVIIVVLHREQFRSRFLMSVHGALTPVLIDHIRVDDFIRWVFGRRSNRGCIRSRRTLEGCDGGEGRGLSLLSEE